jgi:hypothetical protein
MADNWNPYDTPEIAEFRKAQVEEYTAYVAVEDLFVGSALGYRRGDPVPKSIVEAEGNPWSKQGKVVPRRGDEGLAILEETGLLTDDDAPPAEAPKAKATTVKASSTTKGGGE